MCGGAIETSQLLTGAATAALVRAIKKRKLAPGSLEQEQPRSPFEFADLFDAMAPADESFPSLKWEFIEGDFEEEVKSVKSVPFLKTSFESSSHKRRSDGLLRPTKSLLSGLEALNKSMLSESPSLCLREFISSQSLPRTMAVDPESRCC